MFVVLVGVGLGTGVLVGPTGVAVGVASGCSVGVGVGWGPSLGVGLGTGVLVGSTVGVGVGSITSVAVGVGVLWEQIVWFVMYVITPLPSVS